MRRATFAVVEGVLRDFPRICVALSEREHYLEALAQGGGDSPRFEGGEKLSGPEALCDMKNGDVEYCELTAVTESVGGGAARPAGDAFAAGADALFREHESSRCSHGGGYVGAKCMEKTETGFGAPSRFLPEGAHGRRALARPGNGTRDQC